MKLNTDFCLGLSAHKPSIQGAPADDGEQEGAEGI